MNHQSSSSARLASIVMGITVALLAGCTETLVGFNAIYPSNTVSVVGGPPHPDTVQFALSRNSYPSSKRTVHPMPQRAILKLNGYLPLLPSEVTQEGDRTIIRMRLPVDLIKTVKAGAMSHTQIHGELILPFDVGVPAFGGGEYREPRSQTVHVQLTPVFNGPMTRTAEKIGGFLRGLYAAR